MCTLEAGSLSPLWYVAKGNRIDREEVRAQLQKFQHAKVDRPAVPPYVTRFARERNLKKKNGEKWEKKEEKKRAKVEEKEKENTRNVFFRAGRQKLRFLSGLGRRIARRLPTSRVTREEATVLSRCGTVMKATLNDPEKIKLLTIRCCNDRTARRCLDAFQATGRVYVISRARYV